MIGKASSVAIALPTYVVRRAVRRRNASARDAVPALTDLVWNAARVARIKLFHPNSKTHLPMVSTRLLYDDSGLFGRFDVTEQHVLARHTTHHSMVCQDSCVEVFFQPTADSGYFNFEFNPLGTMQVFFITDPARVGETLSGKSPNIVLQPGQLKSIRTRSTLTQPILEPISKRTLWSLGFSIEWNLIRQFVPNFAPNSGARANFYKCADNTPKPHWASWSDIGPVLSFHQPSHFGHLEFQVDSPRKMESRKTVGRTSVR
jgi:hypothetical protein